MHATVVTIAMMALGVVTGPRATAFDGQVTTPAAHQAQADQVSVLKVEGMT